jgi:type IV pilus assembly protein PilB
VGCPDCQHTGYKGRVGIFEFLPMSESLRELIVQGASLADLRRHAVDQGMVTLREAGLAAITSGATSAEEVLKYT